MTKDGQLTLYRDCEPIVDAHYISEGPETLTETLITAIADAVKVDETELPPLYHTIDLEAIDRLLEQHTGAADAKAVLSFEFESLNVFVRADGRICICDGTQPTEPSPVFGAEAI